MKEVVAEITALARRSPEINQRSGVSVRVSIANYETVISNALRRAIIQGEKEGESPDNGPPLHCGLFRREDRAGDL